MAKTPNDQNINDPDDKLSSEQKSSKPKSSNAKDSNKSGNEIVKARIKMWQTIAVAIITTIGGGIFGYGIKKSGAEASDKQSEISVPISNTVNLVDKLPEESNSGEYLLLKDISIFDLRQWRITPDSCLNKRYSPANYTNYLHVKKIKPLNNIIIHYATSGYAIDMRCITHAYTVQQRKDPIEHAGEKVKEYAMNIDVSNVDIGKEFLIVVEATYWNGFNDPTHNDASTYTDDEINGLNELGLIVFFPDNKPFKQTTKIDRDTKTDAQHEYRGIDEFYADESKKFIYWDIRERAANHHYKLQWTW